MSALEVCGVSCEYCPPVEAACDYTPMSTEQALKNRKFKLDVTHPYLSTDRRTPKYSKSGTGQYLQPDWVWSAATVKWPFRAWVVTVGKADTWTAIRDVNETGKT